jgi:hypothetical protein
LLEFDEFLRKQLITKFIISHSNKAPIFKIHKSTEKKSNVVTIWKIPSPMCIESYNKINHSKSKIRGLGWMSIMYKQCHDYFRAFLEGHRQCADRDTALISYHPCMISPLCDIIIVTEELLFSFPFWCNRDRFICILLSSLLISFLLSCNWVI